MMRILLISTLFLSINSWAQDSAKVLFIGNSYTYVNDLPQMVTDLAASMGDYVYHDDQTIGGATFQNHASNAATYTKINSDQWDFVVLQAQSQEPSFPDAQVDAETLPYAIQLADSVYANDFCSVALFFMTWGRENGDPQWGPISTYDGMQGRLRNAYLRFADSVQGSVSPVGMVWKHVRENYPAIDLYNADESHPSIQGSYAAACTFYAAIFRKSPVGAPYISTLDSLQATQIQAAAEFVVLDSLDFWNLHPMSEFTQADFTFSVNTGQVNFTNESTKAQTYTWDFGDGQTSTDENPMITYSSNGQYTVTLIAESECDTDTISYMVNIDGLGLTSLDPDLVRLESLGNSLYRVYSDASVSSIEVFDFAGSKVVETNEVIIDLSGFSSGMYLMHIHTDQGIASVKLMR